MVSSNLVRLLFFGVFLCCALTQNLVFAQDCQTATSIPDGQKKLGGGTATADYDGTTEVQGGQAVYVRIKNDNALGVSYYLTIVYNASPPVSNCTYKALLPPQTSAILSGSLFKDPPIAWKITVAVGPESDAGTLTYEVYSKP
jgi:hypothetical protein